MKKSVIIFLLMVTTSILFIGCSTKTAKDETLISDSFEKTQKIDIISSDGSDMTTISDDSVIKEFVLTLKIDEWNLDDIPSNAIQDNTYKIYQQATEKLWGGINQNRNLKEVATLTAFKNVPYIEFNIKGFSLNFKVPEDVAKHLNSIQ